MSLSTLEDSERILVFASLVPAILILGVGLGRYFKRKQGVRLGIAFQLFSISLSLWLPLSLYLAICGRPTGWDWLTTGNIHLGALTALFGALVSIAFIRRYFWEVWFEKTQATSAPKFLSQITGLLLFIGIVVIVIRFIYGQELAGFAIGSTVVAAIIGFALQDLLGNIIAGISLEIGKPFRTGDWLTIENLRAEVIEVNWRSTRLRTTDDIYIDLPNRMIVSTKIVNLTFPTRQHALRLQVGFDYSTPPNAVKDCLARAASAADGVLSSPPPKVYLKDFGESAISYEIKFWIVDESQYTSICDSIRTNIWYGAQRAGLNIPFPIRTIHVEKAPKKCHEEIRHAAKNSILKHPFFQTLEPEQVDHLARQARLIRFGRGEKVIEQGAMGDSMFLVLAGDANVYVSNNGIPTRVATLRPGDYCGEMSLLTGELRSATVVAESDCELWEIDKTTFGELLQKNEPLVQNLGEILARRRMENEGILANHSTNGEIDSLQKKYTEGFLMRLYSFFEL